VAGCRRHLGVIRLANLFRTFLVSDNDEGIPHPVWFSRRVQLAENMPGGKHLLALAREARMARDWNIEEAGEKPAFPPRLPAPK
jgi:hypothetical protein